MEGMFSFLTSLKKESGDFINIVNFRNKQSVNKWANDCKVFQIHVKFNSFHTEATAKNLKVIKWLCSGIVNDITTIRKRFYSLF